MLSKYIQKRVRSFRRWRKRYTPLLTVAAVLSLVSGVVYAYSMSSQSLSADPSSFKPLLDLVARAESNGNYNAYFGNAGNTNVTFTDMSIAQVLQWQKEYIAKGSPSSAVGRYQIIDTTLEQLVRQLQLDPSEPFDATTQDRLALALMERRGASLYVNKQLSPEEFATNLAKEWAGLPQITGNRPGESYYAADGLNASRVAPHEVLAAIRPIKAR